MDLGDRAGHAAGDVDNEDVICFEGFYGLEFYLGLGKGIVS